MKRILAATFLIIATMTSDSVRAADVIEEWATIKPAAPTLKPVTVDPKTTALLMLDFMKQNCGQRPRCMASLPAMKKLLEAARAAKATIIYSIIANSKIEDVLPEVAARDGEPSVLAGPDKFRNTDLEKILKDKGIQTVITVGTASNGAVLYTQAARRFAA
jgi:nicotinamidase-related amidase